MRMTLLSTGAVAAFATLVLAACGGGSSGSTPTVAASAAPLASMSPNQVGLAGTGVTSTVSLTIAIPRHATQEAVAAVRARVFARYGSKANDPRIRTMANTSPSASIRAAGVQQNRYAADIFNRTRRDPSFISAGTQYMEMVITQGASLVYDETSTCPISASTCTGNFTSVPVGSGYSVTVYLYDGCNYLLSAGTTSNVAVTAGNNTQVTITLNGVVSYYDVQTTAQQPFISDPSAAQSNFTVSVTPLDADFQGPQVISTPGVLLDTNFKQITSVSLTTNPNASTDITPTTAQSLTVQSDNTLPSTTYSFNGNTNADNNVTWTATSVTAASVYVPQIAGYPSTGTNVSGNGQGQLSVSVNAPTLAWTNPNTYAGFTTSGDSYIEIPAPTTQTYTFGLAESASAFSGNVTLTDNGQCSTINSVAPGEHAPFPYVQASSAPYIEFTMANIGASSGCVITATDDGSPARTANLHINVDQTSLTINNKARKH